MHVAAARTDATRASPFFVMVQRQLRRQQQRQKRWKNDCTEDIRTNPDLLLVPLTRPLQQQRNVFVLREDGARRLERSE